MPKKKSISDQQSAVSNQLSVEVEVNANKLLATDQYQKGTWAGQPHFECAKCAFDSMNEIEMLNHLVHRHNSEEALAILITLEPTAPTVPSQTATSTQSGDRNEVYEIELKEDQENA